jgi:hypothetical protein
MKKLVLLVTTMALVAVGAASFAAFESHLIDVKAHVEKATWVSPDGVDFGSTIMEQSYHKDCAEATGVGDCMKIHLSDSFLTQTQFRAVDYSVYCEDKPVGDADRGDGNITPFMQISDSDPTDGNDVVDLTSGCGTVAYGSVTGMPPLWAHGVLNNVSDKVDLWDMAFFAPLCKDNYNAITDPVTAAQLATQPGGGLIDPAFCHKGPNGDSDEFTNLASLVKFQVTKLEVGTP